MLITNTLDVDITAVIKNTNVNRIRSNGADGGLNARPTPPGDDFSPHSRLVLPTAHPGTKAPESTARNRTEVRTG
jgi:hypothetical protein